MKVFIIPAEMTDELQQVEAPEDPEFSAWCNKKVGGWLELHTPRNFPRSGVKFWFDEEGKIKHKKMNRRATALSGIWPDDMIVGDVIVTGSRGATTAEAPMTLLDLASMVDAFLVATGLRIK